MRSFITAPLALLLVLLPRSVFIAATVRTKDGGGDGDFLIGTGIYDITGPAAQINFMGYARASQTAHGIHQRLRSRAFIMAQRPTNLAAKDDGSSNDLDQDATVSSQRSEHPRESEEYERERSLLRWKWNRHGKNDDDMRQQPPTEAALADPEKTVCFVSIDTGMGSDLLNMRVVARLEELLPTQGESRKRLCHLENLSISGTHTHSAPAGFLQYTLYQMTSYGFSEETINTLVEGVAQSIRRAYDSLQQGSIETSTGRLLNTNINRSPSSYLLNPQSERDEYADEGDTDKSMLLLKFKSQDGSNVGALSWFAVHGTNMNNTNTLISGDNKGYASYLMEKHYNGKDTLPGQGKFVAAFASTNLGDVSPNTAGPRCIDTGLPCDTSSSTCNGRTELCIAFGPGNDMFESTEIIGRNQYERALSLFQNTSAWLTGDVDFRHSFVDMSNRSVVLENGDIVHTCPAALGYSMAAGTTDGPGDFDFTQGSNSSNPFWNMITGFLSNPSKEQIACHHPKPILLNVGKVKEPYDWDPDTVPVSIFKVGKLFILNVPAEFTTMAGRRLRRAVRNILVRNGIDDPIITIAGLANSYTHYVVTHEEYEAQRYEAASCCYGPHTLKAYIQEFERLTQDLLEGRPSASDRGPSDLSKRQISLLPPVILDTIGIGKRFGSLSIDANDEYVAGIDSVFVSFRSANPRNNQRIEGTFLTVDMLGEDGSWKTKYVDGDWCTRFFWKGGEGYFGMSYAEITWTIPGDTSEGLYRICHYGTRKTLFGDTTAAFFHAPDWFLSSGFGSTAISLIVQVFKLATSFSENVIDRVSMSKYKDFSGCSKTFLVRKQ